MVLTWPKKMLYLLKRVGAPGYHLTNIGRGRYFWPQKRFTLLRNYNFTKV